ncbi:TPA: ead/Ea22-like family protein [Enterobacter roggenkampii]
MSNIDKRALREAAEKATALNLDTAQVKRGNDGYLECPCCEGAGYVEEENDFCNIDGVALGVQFYGIGEHHGLAESYLRAANPSTVLALLDELEAKDKLIADQCGIIASARKFISEYAGLGDVGAAEFIKIIDRAAAGKGEAS